jgi:hypothetical protein
LQFSFANPHRFGKEKTNHASSHIKLKGILNAGKPAVSNFAKPMRFGKGELGLAKEN